MLSSVLDLSGDIINYIIMAVNQLIAAVTPR